MKLDETVKLAKIPGQESRWRSQNNRGFFIMLGLSIFVHGCAVPGLALFKGDSKPKVDLSRAIPVQLVKLGKRRNPKLLPRIARNAPPPPPSEGVALDRGKKKKQPNKSKKRNRKAEKKEQKISDAARRMLESNALDDALDKFSTDEPEGDPDGDIDGTTTDATNAAAGYHRDIVKVLKAKYKVPTVIPRAQRQFLKARVVLFIEGNGQISDFEFIERHPNQVFMRALDSLLKTVKLPPPPRKQAREYRRNGVEIIFRP